jgi:hypothetical protein
MSLLVYTPSPFPTESLWGFLLRVAEGNGYETPQYVLDLLKPGPSKNAVYFSYEQLAAPLAMEPSQLRHMSLGPTNGNHDEWLLMGHHCGKGFRTGMRLRHPAICVQCIQDKSHIEAFWDLKNAIACPTHKSLLVDHCPSCHAPLSWYRPGLLTCRCGGDISKAKTVTASTLEIGWMEFLQQKLYNLPLSALENRLGFPIKKLEAIPMKEMLSIVGRLNTLGSRSGLGNDSGLMALANWPQNYHSYLNQIGTRAAKQASNNTIGLSAFFDDVSTTFFKTSKDKRYAGFLHDEFLRFGRTQWSQHVVFSKSHSAEHSGDRIVSLNAIKKQLGLTIHKASVLANNGLLPAMAVRTKRGAVRYIVNAAEVKKSNVNEKVSVSREAKITLKQLVKQLGIPESVLVLLEQSGFIAKDNQTVFKERFNKGDVTVFENQLLERATVRDGLPPAEGHISFTYALTRAKFGSAENKVAFVKDYLQGSVIAAGRWGSTIRDIYFEDELIQKYVSAGLRSKYSTVSRSFVAKTLECQARTVPGLVADGHLVSVTSETGFDYITKDSLADFSKLYASCAGLATEFGTTAKHLAKIAKKAGIHLLEIQVHQEESFSSFVSKADVARLKSAWQAYPTRS